MRRNKFQYNPFFLFNSNVFFNPITNDIILENLVDNETFLLETKTNFFIKNQNNIQLKLVDLGYTNLTKNNFKKSFIEINKTKYYLSVLGFNDINNDFKIQSVLSKKKNTNLFVNISFFNALTGKLTVLTKDFNPDILINSENINLTYV